MLKHNPKQHDISVNPQKAVSKGGSLIKKAQSKEIVGYAETEILNKASLKRIKIGMLPKQKPDFDLPGSSKDNLIAEWLKEWIQDGIAKGTLNESHLMPIKADIAAYLKVSAGTVQNAIRFIEDEGFVESKQRIGTIIRNPDRENSRLRKLSSKRDSAVIAVKKMILDRHFQPGQALPSAREIARIIGSAPNTTRLALEFLGGLNIVEGRGTRGNKANWFLRTAPVLQENERVQVVESVTLIDQVERDLKVLIAANFKVGDKLPSHFELSETLRVSIKTLHDAMSRMIEQGIVKSKRGRYGTYILRMPEAENFLSAQEAALVFMPAQDATFYNYEKVENHLKTLLSKKFKPGDKLPAMSVLAESLDVSSNTIRKALHNLSEAGFVRFERGRYGGTFVLDIPEVQEEKAFAWVSINPDTVKNYRQSKTTV
jgi:DNA-binding GntR family transcriptional regulator